MLLERIKHETQSQHRRIEADLNPLDPCFTLADYHALLERFLGYYAPWENTVSASAPLLLGGRSKSAHLIADLQHLGGSPAGNVNFAFCEALPALDTRARILGSLYVLEGATLGGQILRRHFIAKFGLSEQQGCAFFTGYGDRTGAMWKQLGETVNALPVEDWDIAVASAIATFESMHAWLCKPVLKNAVATQRKSY